MPAKRILRGGLLVCLVLPVCLVSQTSPPKKARLAPTGLKILSTTIEPPTALHPELRQVMVTVQNVTANKTVVAYAFVTHEFDSNGREVNPHGEAGIGADFAEPDGANNKYFIPPGQVRPIGVWSVWSPDTVTVNVTLTGLVYEDRSAEGGHSVEIFTARRENAREARKLAAKETGEKKSALEKRAEWYEAHAVEAQQ